MEALSDLHTILYHLVDELPQSRNNLDGDERLPKLCMAVGNVLCAMVKASEDPSTTRESAFSNSRSDADSNLAARISSRLG